MYCGLYRHTDGRPATGREIAAQIRRARETFPEARGLKLYNASSLFEPASILQRDLPEIAGALNGLALVVAEARSENARRAVGFASRLEARLEVAIGLEVADDALLGRLNKPTSTAAFRKAAGALREAGIFLRAFVLVQPPFVAPADAAALARRTFELAREEGARVVSLLPVFPTHRPLRLIAAKGFFSAPSLETLFDAAASCTGRGVTVLVETEHLDRLNGCARCGAERRRALVALNRTGELPGVSCSDHRPARALSVRPFSEGEVLEALRAPA